MRTAAGLGEERPFHERTAAAYQAAEEMIDFAYGLARDRNISPFELPELMLLAAIQMAARIDGTAEGTIQWIQTIAGRLERSNTISP